MGFRDQYFQLKDSGLKDWEIANELGVCRDTVTRWKKIHGINTEDWIVRTNSSGITDRQLKIAVENGLTRRLAIRRVREFGWSVVDAITTPKNHCRKHTLTKVDRSYHNEKQREYRNYKKVKSRIKFEKIKRELLGE